MNNMLWWTIRFNMRHINFDWTSIKFTSLLRDIKKWCITKLQYCQDNLAFQLFVEYTRRSRHSLDNLDQHCCALYMFSTFLSWFSPNSLDDNPRLCRMLSQVPNQQKLSVGLHCLAPEPFSSLFLVAFYWCTKQLIYIGTWMDRMERVELPTNQHSSEGRRPKHFVLRCHAIDEL